MEKKFKKGDKVKVNAVVFTKNRFGRYSWDKNNKAENFYVPENSKNRKGYSRALRRVEQSSPWVGIVVGYSIRKTGIYQEGYGWDDPGCLWDEENHEVVMVIPTDTIQWNTPYACLEKDLE